MEELLDDPNILILPSRNKKKRRIPEQKQQPSPSSLHNMGKLSKNQQRKIRRIQEEEERKGRRCQVIETLKKHVLADSAYALLRPSGALGQVGTLKEKLRRALQFKRAGLKVPSDVPLFCARNGKAITSVTKESSFHMDSEIHQATISQAATFVKKSCVANDTIDATPQVNGTTKSEQMAIEGCTADGILNARHQVNKIRDAEPRDVTSKCQSVTKRGCDLNHLTSVPNANSCYEKKFVVEVLRSAEIEKSRSKLPILMMEQEIMEAICDNAVVIICGETGCGKTTQVPQFLYEAGYGSSRCKHHSGIIGVTQPRRVAVFSTARRVAHEVNLKLGHEIGFQVRHDKVIGNNCCIKFMTDGILLREVQADFLLRKYSVIIIDEAHERSLNTDILIGMLSRILPLRQELFDEHCKAVAAGKAVKDSFVSPLKLIIMSATLHLEDFVSNKNMFPIPLPIVEVPTRQFPVTIHFSAKTELVDYVDKAYKKVCAIHKKLPAGGILVFLTGQKEVHFLCRKLVNTFCKTRTTLECGKRQDSIMTTSVSGDNDDVNVDDLEQAVDSQCDISGSLGYINDDMSAEEADENYDDLDDDDILSTVSSDTRNDKIDCLGPGPVRVLPLYAMLPVAAQLHVFDAVPEGTRLVVVATNVAETSITIPNIRYVVDCGRAKKKDYDRSNGVAEYRVSWISKASAAQRAGRAGRTGPGHCYRLYSSAVFNDMFSDFCVPEINRVPIEGLVLLLKCMGISKVINFPFPSQPDSHSLVEAEKCLLALSALDSKSHLPTKLGKIMATYPISPRHSRLLVSLMWRPFGNHLTANSGLLFAYATAVASGLSLDSPFLRESDLDGERTSKDDGKPNSFIESRESITRVKKLTKSNRKNTKFQSTSSDALSVATALRLYESAENREEFCKSNFLHAKTMHEMSKLRQQLIRLFLLHMNDSYSIDEGCCELVWNLDHASDIEALWFQKDQTLTQEQEERLRQAICAGWADRVAKKLTLHECMKAQNGKYMNAVRYQSSAVEEPVFLHPSSSLSKTAPEFVVYNELISTSKLYMRCVTSVESKWLASQASALCTFSAPLTEPAPWYDTSDDDVKCWVSVSFGPHMWALPLQSISMTCSKYRTAVFASALLQGKVLSSLASLRPYLAADPCIVLKPEGRAYKRVSDLLQALRTGNSVVDTRRKLKAMWVAHPQFLFHEILSWLQKTHRERLDRVWIEAKHEISLYDEKQL